MSEAVEPYHLPATVLQKGNLRLKNRRALALLESWLAEPDDLGDEWWEDFLKDIDRCRLQVS